VGRVGVAARSSLLRPTPEAAALVLIGLGAWVVVGWLAAGMGSMPGTMGLGVAAFVGVWTLMMAAMMMPSIAPVAALYARSFGADRPRRLVVFAAGYLLVWAAAGLPAFAVAWAIDHLAEAGGVATRAVVAGLFLAVAVYQLTPLKRMCLEHCRSPLAQLLHYASFRGRLRDLRVGAHHAAFCLGCCWALMMLLVALGTMNLLVMVGLAAFVLLEKYAPHGVVFSRFAAVAAGVLAVAAIASPQAFLGLPSG
jgi:predicted metal-binding membrane protein